ncbi:MAG: glycosyl hydrolase family 28-related protein [Oscillospiraceae bacterium]|nr:glycosyl hydrolase family 28-related protein [Oscillospiraceae bacterium]
MITNTIQIQGDIAMMNGANNRAGNMYEHNVRLLVFETDWEDGLTLTIVYTTPAGVVIAPRLLSGSATSLTRELLDAPGSLKFTLYGKIGDEVVHNATGNLIVNEAISETGIIPSPEIPHYINTSIMYYSLKAAGAAGDGIVDDTEIIQNAIDLCGLEGRILLIDKGTFRFTRRLNIQSSLRLQGASHADSILSFDGGDVHEEIPFDLEYWEHSNAAISVQCGNSRIENFTLTGGTKENPSAHYGIIYHYPGEGGTNYASGERTYLSNVDIKCFKSGEFRYAGWNKYSTCCHYIDCAEYGIQYYPLEEDTVGNWSGSGDVMISSQFIGNGLAGLGAKALFETTFFNCVFEYNHRAIDAERCNNVTFKNCWNEANDNNIRIVGNIRFEGGYNISPATVDHEPESENDIVMFQGQATNTIYHGNEIRYNQIGGIITKGVELSVEVDNMFQNPEFTELSGGTEVIPSLDAWDPLGSWEVSEDVQYLGQNSAYFFADGAAADFYFGIRQEIAVEPGKKYTITVKARTPDRRSFDSDGCVCWITHRNALHEAQWHDNRSIEFISDNAWEDKTFEVEVEGDTAYLYVGFGCVRNGNVYFAAPTFSAEGSLAANNVFIRRVDATKISVTDMSGTIIGTITFDEYRG